MLLEPIKYSHINAKIMNNKIYYFLYKLKNFCNCWREYYSFNSSTFINFFSKTFIEDLNYLFYFSQILNYIKLLYSIFQIIIPKYSACYCCYSEYITSNYTNK